MTDTPDAARVLDTLDRGVLVLARDLCVLYANARWTSWLGVPVRSGAEFAGLLAESAVPAELQLRATFADGRPRTFVASLRPGDSEDVARRIVCTVHRTDAVLIVEARADTEGEPAALTEVARRLAEATDIAEVLPILCEMATQQCHGSGAAVLRVLEEQGEVVAASGDLVEASGTLFELNGSLLMEAITGDAIIFERNYGASSRPLMRVRPQLSVGPVIVAPLRAHAELLGVIAVARGVGAASFDESDINELRVLADHAALAVHKSLLLLRAQSADRAKSRFLATMSHELRTPLTALAGYHELLIDQVIGPISESQLDILERVRSVTTHLSSMIEEILSFTSLEEGHEVVRPSEFLAADLVRAAVALVQPLADQKKLPITLELPRAHVRMTSDIDKLRQVLVNLLGNAVKFTDAGGITVSVKLTGGVVWLAVKDTGVGIPAGEQVRLFRPFAQVDSGLTRRHGGTGLGLYISRRIVTMLGGHIELASEPEKGSTFRVALPQVWESRG
ncbi:MAG: HAMP domain-containing histidine kinase [Gemmatimonadota bacterium]|nr:HAMP domain-containing histidine kinase [Gemmatimonadota bacterium]